MCSALFIPVTVNLSFYIIITSHGNAPNKALPSADVTVWSRVKCGRIGIDNTYFDPFGTPRLLQIVCKCIVPRCTFRFEKDKSGFSQVRCQSRIRHRLHHTFIYDTQKLWVSMKEPFGPFNKKHFCFAVMYSSMRLWDGLYQMQKAPCQMGRICMQG